MPKHRYKIEDRKLQASESDQSVYFTEIGSYGPHKLKFALRSNAYKGQGYATVSRFDGEKWQQISRIVPDAMITPEGLIYKAKRPIDPRKPEGVSDINFIQDLTQLRADAWLILG